MTTDETPPVVLRTAGAGRYDLSALLEQGGVWVIVGMETVTGGLRDVVELHLVREDVWTSREADTIPMLAT